MVVSDTDPRVITLALPSNTPVPTRGTHKEALRYTKRIPRAGNMVSPYSDGAESIYGLGLHQF